MGNLGSRAYHVQSLADKVVEVGGKAAVEHSQVEADVQRLYGFPSQSRTDRTRNGGNSRISTIHQPSASIRCHSLRQIHGIIGRSVLVAQRTPGKTGLQLAHQGLIQGEEFLSCDVPTQRERTERTPAVFAQETGRTVITHVGGYEIPVFIVIVDTSEEAHRSP